MTDWIKCSERMPEDAGRYWCYVEEQNDLGKSDGIIPLTKKPIKHLGTGMTRMMTDSLGKYLTSPTGNHCPSRRRSDDVVI